MIILYIFFVAIKVKSSIQNVDICAQSILDQKEIVVDQNLEDRKVNSEETITISKPNGSNSSILRYPGSSIRETSQPMEKDLLKKEDPLENTFLEGKNIYKNPDKGSKGYAIVPVHRSNGTLKTSFGKKTLNIGNDIDKNLTNGVSSNPNIESNPFLENNDINILNIKTKQGDINSLNEIVQKKNEFTPEAIAVMNVQNNKMYNTSIQASDIREKLKKYTGINWTENEYGKNSSKIRNYDISDEGKGIKSEKSVDKPDMEIFQISGSIELINTNEKSFKNLTIHSTYSFDNTLNDSVEFIQFIANTKCEYKSKKDGVEIEPVHMPSKNKVRSNIENSQSDTNKPSITELVKSTETSQEDVLEVIKKNPMVGFENQKHEMEENKNKSRDESFNIVMIEGIKHDPSYSDKTCSTKEFNSPLESHSRENTEPENSGSSKKIKKGRRVHFSDKDTVHQLPE